MDSLSQLVLGAAVAAAIAPADQRRRALLLGAALGTLPDLDVLIDYGSDVANMTSHRGFSHSLFVLTALTPLLWALLRWRWPSVRTAPGRWALAIWLALVTHPLLDAQTVYGTQLFWPLTTPPVVGGSVFIIDPLPTLALLVAVVLAWRWRERATATRALWIGLALFEGYLAWGLSAQALVTRFARDSLPAELTEAPLLVTATPFNTLLWRVVVLTPDGYLEGDYSLLADDDRVRFQTHAFDRALLTQAGSVPAVQRLLWFSHGFQRADVEGEELILSDLRMGQHPLFFFRHVVARRENGQWMPADNRRLPVARLQAGQLQTLWRRIWGAESTRASK